MKYILKKINYCLVYLNKHLIFTSIPNINTIFDLFVFQLFNVGLS